MNREMRGIGMKKNRMAGGLIKNCKKRGEWAELVFAMRAIERGLHLARPWGESSGYDFVVDQGRRGVRVQVKSTIFPEGEGYSCSLKDSKGGYKKNSWDFLAAYVIPVDIWYIIPGKKVRGMWSVGLHPELEKSKYGEYEEAWHLLHGKERGTDCRRKDLRRRSKREDEDRGQECMGQRGLPRFLKSLS
jgi:hypothetical protein